MKDLKRILKEVKEEFCRMNNPDFDKEQQERDLYEFLDNYTELSDEALDSIAKWSSEHADELRDVIEDMSQWK